MKREEAFKSAYLSKEDVAQPIIRTVQDVRIGVVKGENQDEEKPIMHFVEAGAKCMVLNNTNWEICERAYGADTDDWIGKCVEIYVDPNVTMRGRRVGGVRLRIPTASSQPGSNGIFATFGDAVREASRFDITADQIRAVVKANGGSSWVPQRDSKLVQAMIAELANDMTTDGEIPF